MELSIIIITDSGKRQMAIRCNDQDQLSWRYYVFPEDRTSDIWIYKSDALLIELVAPKVHNYHISIVIYIHHPGILTI